MVEYIVMEHMVQLPRNGQAADDKNYFVQMITKYVVKEQEIWHVSILILTWGDR